MIFEETRKALKRLGLPEGDAFDLPSSDKRFPDGAHFRIECPTVNSSDAVAALLDRSLELGITILDEWQQLLPALSGAGSGN